MTIKYFSDFTSDDLAEVDRIQHIPEEDRTDEEKMFLDQFIDALELARHECEVLSEQATRIMTARITELAQQQELARNTLEAMYNAALARLEAANNG